MMKKIFTLSMIGALCLMAISLQAQRVVSINPTTDFENPSDIFPVIMGDTLADGSRVDLNTVYELANGGFYITSGRLVNKPEWPLQIVAADLSPEAERAVISRIPNASGTYPDIMFPEGDVVLKKLWIVAGEKGPLEDHDWGKIRVMGENSTIIVDDCLIEKDRGGFLQFRANGCKVYVSNCVFRNGGNRRIMQGNGRVVDARNFVIDSLVVKNCLMYNLQDRIFRSQGGTAPHGYIEFDHNTIFNQHGRHGCFQFGKADEVVVTNNLISNPIMQGTTPYFCDEQTQVDNDAHKVFTIDGTADTINTVFTFSHNNIFWSQDVLDFYDSNDTIAQPGIYSATIVEKLGGEAAAEATYFSEVLELNAVPGSILQYAKDLYANPSATDMYDIIVEDISRAGTGYDSGNLFDFSTFDAAYDPASQSATGDMDGNAVGAVEISTVGFFSRTAEGSSMSIYPNPSAGNINLEYTLGTSSQVRVSVYDISGREQLVLMDEFRSAGTVQINADLASELNAGLYMIRVKSAAGSEVAKFILK